MAEKNFYFAVVFLGSALFLFEGSLTGSSFAEVQITSSTATRLIFEYSPDSLTFIPVTIDGETGVRVEVKHCGVLYEPGAPVLPCRTLFIGIPGSGAAKVEITEIQYVEQPSQKIFPAPDTEKPKPPVNIQTDVIYSTDHFFPKNHLAVIGESWLRRQRVLEIEVYPVLYNPVSNRVRVCEKMAVKIDFIEDTSFEKQTNGITDPMFEDVYPKIMLNAAVAKKWRQAAPKMLGKPGGILSGSWYKIAVERDGFYKIDDAAFAQIGFDSASLDPTQVQMFYGGGRELPQDLAHEPIFREIATGFVDANHDGRFGKNDFFYFFGQATSGWAFDTQQSAWSHYINHFTNQNIYWISIGNGNRKALSLKNAHQIYPASAKVITNYRKRIFQEAEKVNPEKSGTEWIWDWLRGTTSRDYPIELADVVAAKPATLRTRVQGVTEYHHDVSFYLNGQLLKNIDLPYTLAKITPMNVTGLVTSGKNTLRTFLQSNAMKNEIFFDWFELEYGRELRTANDWLDFNSADYDGVIQFALAGFSTTAVLLCDVTDPFEVIQFDNLISDSTQPIAFRDSVALSAERRYFASTWEQLAPVELIPAQIPAGLRSPENAADYLIITHSSLRGSALDRLAAHRQTHWPYAQSPQVKIVTTDDIYHEFSGGMLDPTAIRDFLRYTFGNWRVAPSSVLLVGDACYDMKNNSGDAPVTLVPTHEDGLRASDDWFVCLDGDRLMDMLIGRLAVSSLAELEGVVNKIIQYDDNLPSGAWKNSLVLVADDTYSPTYAYDDFVFGRDTETLATDSIASGFDLNKIFLFQYPRDDFGKKPAANQAFLRALNQGALYVNFLGHGNHEVLTHESIFYSPDDVSLLANGHRLPLFFAGTCAAGYFDYDRKKCLAEELLLKPDGGCFAVIGSSRWNAHAITFIINLGFFRAVLDRTNPPTLGQALLEAKLQCRYPDHRELPILFGDPAQRLALPEYSVNISVSPDSIALTKKVQLHGEIQSAGKTVTDFSGKMFVKLYDAPIKYRPLNYQYTIPGRVLFGDTLGVENGQFSADFFLNADTATGGNLCKLVAYAWEDPQRTDAVGFQDSLYVFADTLSADTQIDSVGPQVQVYINEVQIDADFSEEIAVSPNFTFRAQVRDTGSGVLVSYRPEYHLRLGLDGAIEFDLTSGFNFDSQSNHSGSVQFDLTDVSAGAHELVFSVWDNSLNRTSVELQIYVEPQEFKLLQPLTYPNPAAGKTHFTFTLTHDAEVTLKIYTIAGRLINQFQSFAPRGFSQIPAQGWDCTDQENDPLANGVYLYKIVAKSIRSAFQVANESRQVEAIERLVIMR